MTKKLGGIIPSLMIMTSINAYGEYGNSISKPKQKQLIKNKNQNIKYEKFVDKNGNEHIRKVNRGKR